MRVIFKPFKLNKKDRRHCGRKYPHSTLRMKKKDMFDQCLEPQPYWDDWIDHRDGHRGYNDKTKINGICYCNFFDNVYRYNNKVKREIKIRTAKQKSNRNI